MNMVIEFFSMLFRIPSKEQAEEIFLAVYRLDLEDSIISASRILRGRKSDMDVFLTPFTRKLRRPYSLLRVWTTIELSPTFVVWSTIISVPATMLPLHGAPCPYVKFRSSVLL